MCHVNLKILGTKLSYPNLMDKTKQNKTSPPPQKKVP